MSSFDRYIFRTTFGAFLLILISLTAVIWLTHALREIDLMTNQRQTVLMFIGITGLLIPDAGAGDRADRAGGGGRPHAQPAQHRFGNRRDECVRHVAVAHFPSVPDDHPGGRPCWCSASAPIWRPKGLRELRNWATKVKADFVINIVQPGRFITIERGLTFHIRERRADGQLLGIFIDDRRDPKERVDLPGRIRRNRRDRTRHVSRTGERQRPAHREPDGRSDHRASSSATRSICRALPAARRSRRFGVRERNLWEVAFPDPKDPIYKQLPTHFRAELHDRLVAPLYPIAFTVLCFAILGAPRTSRQSREMSLIMTVVADRRAASHRLCLQRRRRADVAAVYVLYASLLVAFAGGLYAIARGAVLEPPEFVTRPIAMLSERSAPPAADLNWTAR